MTTEKSKPETSPKIYDASFVIQASLFDGVDTKEMENWRRTMKLLQDTNRPFTIRVKSGLYTKRGLASVQIGPSRRKRRSPPLRQLVRLADFLPLTSRKQVKAMAGDYYAEIIRLRRERRYKAARWNEVLAWGYTAWYVLRGPIDQLISTVRKVVKGT